VYLALSMWPRPIPTALTARSKAGESIGRAAARLVEEAILREGAETVGRGHRRAGAGGRGVIVAAG